MSWSIPFAERQVDLASDRIPAEDASRQNRTAEEILRRLERQPGLILADEVGMGKTFVALAVAASVVIARRRFRNRQPVVVMVPPGLKDKWPTEAGVFREKCLKTPHARRIFTWGVARDAVEFFKLLDDSPRHRKALIFLTHGALTHGLNDPWVKLALLRSTFQRRPRLGAARTAFPRMAGRLLRLQRFQRRLTPASYEHLLASHPRRWRAVLAQYGVELDDDPVPEALLEKVRKVDKAPIVEALLAMPRRQSPNLERRMVHARSQLSQAIRQIWREWLAMTETRSPLLILDEAHHFKNPRTRHASLFQDSAAQEDADLLVQGPLAGVFERMLFLTATPFQLGHRELTEVLRRFGAIRWRRPRAPEGGKQDYLQRIASLEDALDEAQLDSLRFETVWGRIGHDHLVDEEGRPASVESWWRSLQDRSSLAPLEAEILKQHTRTELASRKAELLLRPWVIRHTRPADLPAGGPRRTRLEGASIERDQPLADGRGLEVEGPALLPFLLAARASVAIEARIRRGQDDGGRALFAEGLASSYESYLYSRRKSDGRDADAAVNSEVKSAGYGNQAEWYLAHLDRVLPKESPDARLEHPKILRTVERVLALWESGEKVVVFCHFIATGRALREHISRRMTSWVNELAMRRLLETKPASAERRLENLADYFFKEDGLRPVVEQALKEVVGAAEGLAEDDRRSVVDVLRRFVRTPTFLVRYFPLEDRDRARAFRSSLDHEDASGLTLRQQIKNFCEFLASRCTDAERRDYLQALGSIQTGRIRGREARLSFAPEEQPAASELLLPNVRFVFGETKRETRKTLMLAFNTPFFPEILISSSVLAEGVDLHLCCRHVIHHDLDWNPSTLEQRTGRVDRLGAKAEQSGKSIRVYLPYVAGTHDEKQFRVVRDRERWFNVVMGEQMGLDEWSTERIAARVPLPWAAARELTMRLGLEPQDQPESPTGEPV